MPLSEKIVARVFLWLLLVIIGVPILFIESCEFRRRSIESAFNKIKVGDSR